MKGLGGTGAGCPLATPHSAWLYPFKERDHPDLCPSWKRFWCRPLPLFAPPPLPLPSHFHPGCIKVPPFLWGLSAPSPSPEAQCSLLWPPGRRPFLPPYPHLSPRPRVNKPRGDRRVAGGRERAPGAGRVALGQMLPFAPQRALAGEGWHRGHEHGDVIRGWWSPGVDQPAQHPTVSQGVQRAFADLAPKESTSPFPLYINAHSSWPHGRGQSQVGVGVAQGTQARTFEEQISSHSLHRGCLLGEKQKHLLVWAQQEPTHSSSRCACGLLASLLAFLPPAFVSLRFLLLYQSLLVSARIGGAQPPPGAVTLHGNFSFAGCKGW